MSRLLPIFALLLTIGISSAFPALAEPPQSTAYFEPDAPLIACDTREQIMQVVEALKTHRLQETLTALQKTLDAKQEPVCVFSQLGPIVFGASEHLGLAFDHDVGFDVWVSHVSNRNTDFYLLWAESGKGASA
jgi:hypothetical protein